MTTPDHAAFARDIYAAFSDGDVASVLAQAMEDVEIVNVGWDVTDHGHDGFQTFMVIWKSMAPDCRIEVVRQLVADDGVTNECLFHGTHTGPLRGPLGELAATGKPVTLPFCEV